MVYVFCSFTSFLSEFVVFHWKDLVELNVITRYVTSTNEQFFKSKDIVDLHKLNFCITKLFIQCNTSSCCVHMSMVLLTGGVNTSLHVCQSIGPYMSRICPDIKWAYWQKPCHLFQKTDSKVLLVLRYQGSTS